MATLRVTTKVRQETEGYERGQANASVTTTGAAVQVLRNSIGTTEEEIALSSDITGGNGPGYCWLYNADATNFVQVGISTGAYFAKLNAGQSACLPLDAAVTSLFLKADTGACAVEVWVWEA